MSIKNFALEKLTDFVSKADADAAAKTVAEIRAKYPDETTEEIINRLIRRKCLQAGAVGAVTSGVAMVPGLGTILSMTFGVATDIGMTFKLQAELVLEIAFAHNRELTDQEKQKIILAITGISAGSSAAVQKIGQQVAQKATADLAQKSVIKSIPLLGVAASSGTNIVTTYLIGRRADAYFSVDEAELQDWGDALGAITGVDEDRLAAWLSETTENSWSLISGGAQAAADTVVVTGKTTGTAIVVYSKKFTQTLASAGGRLIDLITAGASKIWPFGDRTEESSATDGEGGLAGLRNTLRQAFKKENEEPLDDAAVIEQLTRAEIKDQTVVAMVGAGEELTGEPEASPGYLQQVMGVFSSLPERWQGTDGEPADDSLLEELLGPKDPSKLIVMETNEIAADPNHEGPGFVSRVFNVFKRENTAESAPESAAEAVEVEDVSDDRDGVFSKIRNLF